VANTGNGVISPAHVSNAATYVPSNVSITFTSATTYDVTDLATPANDVIGATYTSGDDIDVGGVRFSITGTAVSSGDVFTTSAGQYKDAFESIQTFAKTLDGSINTAQRNENMAVFLEDLDNFFSRVLEVRTTIGGRLNALDSQRNANEANISVTQETISALRDTDLAEAISQLTLEQATLDAAQAVFSRITSSSLFNYLR
jgi:flagellar hook-associated protein 3 FlgL